MYCRNPFPTLPTVYSQAYSYEEQVCVLAGEVQRVSDVLATMDGVSKEYVAQFVAEQVAPIYDQMAQLTKSVDIRFAAQTLALQDAVAELQIYANERMTDAVEASNSYTDEVAERLDKKIDEAVTAGGLVRSPITGNMVTVQAAVNELASFHQNGITAGDYDALDLTAQAFDDKNLTAFQYDFMGVPA